MLWLELEALCAMVCCAGDFVREQTGIRQGVVPKVKDTRLNSKSLTKDTYKHTGIKYDEKKLKFYSNDVFPANEGVLSLFSLQVQCSSCQKRARDKDMKK